MSYKEQDPEWSTSQANTGFGPRLSVIDTGLEDRMAVIDPETATWHLVPGEELPGALAGSLVQSGDKRREFLQEMRHLRFGLTPSAVYFNPTERCNLNCSYCYLPEEMRSSGTDMNPDQLYSALEKLSAYFRDQLPEGVLPQLVFHGSEPMMAKEAVFSGIEAFSDQFHFGLQTNGTLLSDNDLAFLQKHQVGIGLSLDAPDAEMSSLNRKTWGGKGVFEQVRDVIGKLASYPALNVITTVTKDNVRSLSRMVDFYQEMGVSVCMFNPVRCTSQGGLGDKPDDDVLLAEMSKALDRSLEHFERTGKKLVVANFANILAGILGPTGRRLMCDISPCGGGRCFFAVGARGKVFPCSEFVGMPEFSGGNLFLDGIEDILAAGPIQQVTSRVAENITPCSDCAIRHFCGAPCPAEVYALQGELDQPPPYCHFYEGLIRYAFRVIARDQELAFLWDSWETETEETYRLENLA